MSTSPPELRGVFEAHLVAKTHNTQAVYLRCLQCLESWADGEGLDLTRLQTAELMRFLAEEARHCSSSTIHVRRAALRAFYASLEEAGIIECSPAEKLRLAALERFSSTGPVAYVTDEAIDALRGQATKLGPVHSLTICMLHETPASVSRIARLSNADFAESTKGKTYAILGKSAASCAPWPISAQARDAVDALRGEDDARLISPQTKNPNVYMVRAAVEQTRADAGVQTPNLIDALKNAHRRREREICERLRIEPANFLYYRRTLLKDLRSWRGSERINPDRRRRLAGSLI